MDPALFAQLTTYLALEVRVVDCGHRFVESRDNTVGARLILHIRLFTRLGSTVRWEVCGQPELRIRELGSCSSRKEPRNPLVDSKYSTTQVCFKIPEGQLTHHFATCEIVRFWQRGSLNRNHHHMGGFSHTRAWMLSTLLHTRPPLPLVRYHTILSHN